MPELQVREIELDEKAEQRLLAVVEESVRKAVEGYRSRQELYVEYRRGYKAVPKDKTKNFPWPNASNVVIPVIGMMCDAVVARLTRAMMGAKDFCEVEIKSKQWEVISVPDQQTGQPRTVNLENEIRDWINQFMAMSNSRDRVRTLLADVTLYGEGFVLPRWVDEKRMYHTYDTAGNVIELPVPEYSGVRWDIPAP